MNDQPLTPVDETTSTSTHDAQAAEPQTTVTAETEATPQPAQAAPAESDAAVSSPAAATDANAPNISEQALAKLEQKVTALESLDLQTLTTFKQFWADAKDLNELIRSSRFIDPEVLSAYRQRVDAVCEKVKAHQDELALKTDKVSQTKRAYVEAKIQEAKDLIQSDNQKSQKILRDALACLKDDWSNAKELQLEEAERNVRMTRDDHDACWLLWKQVNEECFVRFKEQKQNNYIAISNDVYTLGETVENADPRDALDAIKDFQKKLKGLVLEKTDWEELRLTLNKYWERADQRFKALKGQLKEGRMRRASHMERRIEFWKTRQDANIQKFNELISKNFDVITRIEQHIEKLQGDLIAARSEQFKEKVQGWINEQQEKIAAIQKANRELNEKIADIEDKMSKVEEDGLPDRPDRGRKKPASETDVTASAEQGAADQPSEQPSAEEPASETVETPVAAVTDDTEENAQPTA